MHGCSWISDHFKYGCFSFFRGYVCFGDWQRVLRRSGCKLEDLQDVKFKFRASTISNVLPSGNLNEQTRLAANYKNRFKNKGEKLH